MSERPKERETGPENDLEYLKKQLEAAEAELKQVEAERGKIMDDLIAGKEKAAKNFNDFLRRLKQAEQKAIEALEAWGDAAARSFNLKD